jgi:hypothetical protein
MFIIVIINSSVPASVNFMVMHSAMFGIPKRAQFEW